jgi:hypothetical protein
MKIFISRSLQNYALNRMEWAGHAASMQVIPYVTLIGKLQGRGPRGSTRRKGVYNIKTGKKVIWCIDGDV